MRVNEPAIRLTNSALRNGARQYDLDILYYDFPESDIYRLYNNDDNDSGDSGGSDDSGGFLFTDPVWQLNDTRDIIQDTLLSNLNEFHGLKYSEELEVVFSSTTTEGDTRTFSCFFKSKTKTITVEEQIRDAVNTVNLKY